MSQNNYYFRFLVMTRHPDTADDDIRWERAGFTNSDAIWDAIALMGIVNFIFSLSVLEIIREMKLKLNGFLKIVLIMTFVMMVKDISWTIAYWPNYDLDTPFVLFVNISELFYAFGSIASTAFSNIIMMTVIQIVESNTYTDVSHYFWYISGFIVLLSIVLSFGVVPALGHSDDIQVTANNVTYWNLTAHQNMTMITDDTVNVFTNNGWIFYLYFQFAQILINMFGVSYILLRIRFMTGLESTKQTLKTLAFKLIYYPLVQVVTVVPFGVSFILWGNPILTVDAENNFYLASTFLYTFAGFGNFLVFLIVQKGAFKQFKSMLLCGGLFQLGYASIHGTDNTAGTVSDDEDELVKKYIKDSQEDHVHRGSLFAYCCKSTSEYAASKIIRSRDKKPSNGSQNETAVKAASSHGEVIAIYDQPVMAITATSVAPTSTERSTKLVNIEEDPNGQNV